MGRESMKMKADMAWQRVLDEVDGKALHPCLNGVVLNVDFLTSSIDGSRVMKISLFSDKMPSMTIRVIDGGGSTLKAVVISKSGFVSDKYGNRLYGVNGIHILRHDLFKAIERVVKKCTSSLFVEDNQKKVQIG